MKSVFVVAVAVLLLCSFTATQARKPSWKGMVTPPETKNLEKKVKAALEKLNLRSRDVHDDVGSTGPAINWTWSSWALGGPTCHDYSNYELVDLSKESLTSIKNSADAIMKTIMDLIIKENLDLGMGLGITYKGKTIYTDFEGSISKGSATKPTEDTIVSIGSITKMFTSVLLNKFMEDGILAETDPVTKFFNSQNPPVFDPVNPYDSQAGADAVTLESLAGQTSGLMREAICFGGPACTEEIALSTSHGIPLYHQPFTRPHYSNYGFSLLGRCCERAARNATADDEDYEHLVVKNILTPFGMQYSGFDYTEDIKKRMAVGYKYTADAGQVVADGYAESICWSNPAGGMYASMKDMLSFASHLAQKKDVLSPDGFEQLFLPGVDLRDGISSYGKYGWEVVYADGFRVLTKGGLVSGFGTEVVILPELELGIFHWINFESGGLASEVTAGVLNAVVPVILDQMEKNQPEPSVPKNVEKIFGSYSYNNVTFVTIDRDKATGVISGLMLGAFSFVVYLYDDELSKSYGVPNVFVFHTVQVPQENLDSCYIQSADGVDNGLIVFQCDEKFENCGVVMPDLRIVGLKDQSSSSGSSACRSSVFNLRLLILSLFVVIGACFRRPSFIICVIGCFVVFSTVTSAAFVGVQERGPAVNWTWNSFFFGPTCTDLTNLSLHDLNASVFDDAFNLLHSRMEQIYGYYLSKCALGFGVTFNGKIIHTDFVGRINADSDVKPDENTVFSIGSVTKMFTSLMMTSLADTGALNTRDPVTKYFNSENPPVFNVTNIFNKDAGASSVTLESLSSQTSGLPRESLCGESPDCPEDLVMTYVNQFPLYHQPLTRPHYSNLGFNLLGHCCERAARKFFGNSSITYENWLNDNVFPVFGMSSSGFDYPDDIKKRMATGYDFDVDNNIVAVDAMFAQSLYWGNPAGGMYSTTSDMMNFATHLLEKDCLLSPNAYELYFFPGAVLADGVSSFGKAGWEVFNANGFRTLTKSGIIGGFATVLALIPELKLGTFFWINTQDTVNVTALSSLTNQLLVPIIIDNLIDAKPSHNVPAGVNDLLGDYDYFGEQVLSIVADDASSQTGIFYGEILNKTAWYEYDEKATNACNKQNTYFFRYFVNPDKISESCFVGTMEGQEDSLFMFQNTGDKWTCTMFEFMATVNKTN